MARSRVPTITHRGRSQVVGQIISPSSTWLHTIALPRSDFTHGFILLMVPSTVSSSNQRRRNVNVYVTDTASEAASQATAVLVRNWVSGYGCVVTFRDWRHKAYFHAADSKLSDGSLSASGGGIRLNSGVIDGAQIELVFRNTHSSVNGVLTLDIEYRVEKVEVG